MAGMRFAAPEFVINIVRDGENGGSGVAANNTESTGNN